ncbi:PQQ-dependent sugar dehydrogenase [Phormidium tenue FACHB-886]|nr:PQQ-dependent sugar dehydrogenase [Phormidium tenue FACHB-886]
MGMVRLPLGVLLVSLFMASCAPSTPSSDPTTTPGADAAPGAASPAAEAIAQTPVTLQQVTLVENLEHPWGIAWLPDGAMLVTERPGRLRIIRDGVLDPNPIPGVAEVLAERQGGLLDVSVHPQFSENQWVYFTYAHGSPNANQTRVARARFDGTALTDWTVIFEVNRTKEQGQHFGSRLGWLPDGTLLVSIGDGGNPPVSLDGDLIRNQAQNLGVRLGKVVRLNDDGSIPTDNPFANQDNADPSVWSYGHRNIQGLAVDPQTSQVWATEHGARGGDELNLLEVGENYGWPLVTHSREYSGGEISPDQSRPELVDPKLVWQETTAPSGLMVYRGDRFPRWQGHLFAGGLVSQDVHRIEVDAAGTVISQEAISVEQRVRDVKQGPDGLIYILTDAPNGRLIRLEPETPQG